MSVIQRIQDKYAKLMAIIIAVALMIFVVMLAFENGGRLFGGPATTVGKVNGHTIEYNDFIKKVDEQEKTMEQRGYGSGAQLQQQAVEAVWNDEVNQVLENSELNKLGITVGKRELGDILYGANPPEDLRRIFTDTTTGQYNGQLAKQQIDKMIRIKKGTEQELQQKDQLINFINYQEKARLTEKYNSLTGKSVNFPRWFVEKQLTDNSYMAKISLVRDYYSANADSTIKITDKEIEDYLSKHKKDFKQQMQESRAISYVAFSKLPSAADSVAAKDKVVELKPEMMDPTKNVKDFVSSQGADNFYDSYINDSAVRIQAKDSIFATPVGQVYGPYLDGGSYALAKVLGVRRQADTVKVRHILVATAKRDQQSGEMIPVRDTATARKLIDSIEKAIKNGSPFDSLVKLSDDNPNVEQPPKKLKGGIYDKVTAGGMVAEFNEFIFGNPVGSKGVVKTEFGYHYIEILSQKGSSVAHKVAYVHKTIESSDETDANASNMASQFAGNSRDQKSFDANAEKLLKEKGINRSSAGDITPTSYSVGGLGQSRPLVKNIYAAKLGEVLEPLPVGDNYVVAIVTDVNEEGSLSAVKARPFVEPLLRNKKIADKIKNKIGNITTLEAAAAALGGKQIENIDSLRMLGAQARPAMAIASEAKVIGAAFNPANKGKMVTEAIAGSSGVYVVRVDDVVTTPVSQANVAELRKSKAQNAPSQAKSPIQTLREAANISDKRIKFF